VTRTGHPMCRSRCWDRPCQPTPALIRMGTGQRRASLGRGHADVIKNGMTPAAAVDKAFRRAEAIFAQYTFE